MYEDTNLVRPSGGAGVKVGVIDTGVAPHLDLVRRLVKCADYTPSILLPPCADSMNHGTLVASVIAADGGEDGLGMWGVAPEASIYSYRVCEPNRECWGAYVADGIWGAIADSVNIINLSLEGPGHDAAIQAAIDTALAHNILVVAASGNAPPFSYIAWPASYGEVVSVGALDQALTPWTYSAPGFNDGDYVREARETEVAAPGADVLSALKSGCWVLGSGTSLASPMVAGLAAKIWNGSALETRGRIDLSARLHDVNEAGDDSLTGFGMPTVHPDHVSFVFVSATSSAGGVIIPGGSVPIVPGANQVFTISPSGPCHPILNVKVDGVSKGPITSYTLVNVTGPHTIEATFGTLGPYSITGSAGAGGAISPSGTFTVPCGTTQTYAIAPYNCYRIENVKVDGVSLGPISNYAFSNVAGNHTITASFAGAPPLTITASAGPGGTITPPGASSVACGNNRTYAITPAACYSVQDVKVDGVSIGRLLGYTFNTVTANHTISATFQPGGVTIDASAGPGGTITPSGTTAVTCGSSQSYAIAATGTSCGILDVVVDGASQGPITSYTFTNIAAYHTISATFLLGSYTITASAGPGGTITPSGATSVACRQSQTYAIVAEGCAVRDVVVDGQSRGPITSYTFSNVSADHTIDATFFTGNYTITASADAGGTITPAGATSVACGQSQTYAIGLAAGCAIKDVVVDGVSRGPVTSYTFSHVTADHTIAASFYTGAFTIEASAGAGGTITPAGATSVACGQSQTYTIGLAAGCAIKDVVVDGVSQGPITSYTFSNVLASHTIAATFISGTFTLTASAGAGGTITPSGTASVPCGQSRTYTIATAGACGILDVRVDGVSVGPVTSYTFSNVLASHTIAATFTPGPFTISATASGGATITPSGPTLVSCRGSQTFAISPTVSCGTGDVRVDGASMGPITSYTFTNVTANHTISVTAPGGPFTITATPGLGGSISPRGASVVACSGSITYLIYPDNCFRIDNVKVDGVPMGPITSYTFTDVRGPHTITSTYSPAGPFVVEASADPGGTISPPGATLVACGASRSFAIAPADNCHVIQDLVVDGGSRGPLASYTFSGVTTDHTIRAVFAELGPYAVTVGAGAGGTISPGTSSVRCGGDQAFTIAGDDCHQVQDVKVDGIWRGPITSYTFTDVRGPHAIEAVFSDRGPFAIDAGAGPGGTISPKGGSSVACGSDRTYAIAPADDCHAIQDVTVDGASQGPVASYTFGHVTGAHAIQATFAALGPFTIDASAGPGATISPAGASLVACGAAQSFAIASGEACRVVDDVHVDGASVGAVATYTFRDVHAHHTIAASSAASGLALAETHTSASFSGVADGAIDLTVTGGVPPYTFAWSNGASTEDVAGLAAGTYDVSATDAQGCTQRLSIAIVNLGPAEVALGRPAPNPTSGPLRVRFGVPTEGAVRLSVLDLQGREVAVLAQGTQPAGWTWASWNGETGSGRAPGGMYFLRLRAGGRQIVQRFALVR
jgi:hypothetical protein